jgi:hypothetical protein
MGLLRRSNPGTMLGLMVQQLVRRDPWTVSAHELTQLKQALMIVTSLWCNVDLVNRKLVP